MAQINGDQIKYGTISTDKLQLPNDNSLVLKGDGSWEEVEAGSGTPGSMPSGSIGETIWHNGTEWAANTRITHETYLGGESVTLRAVNVYKPDEAPQK